MDIKIDINLLFINFNFLQYSVHFMINKNGIIVRESFSGKKSCIRKISITNLFVLYIRNADFDIENNKKKGYVETSE